MSLLSDNLCNANAVHESKVFNILNFLLFTIGRRIPLEDVPEDEQECSTWLHKLYQEKVGLFVKTARVSTCSSGSFIVLVDLHGVHV